MRGERILFRLSLAATLAVWLAMTLWTMPALDAAGGGPILDLRFTGYERAEAEAFLAALGPDGRDYYLTRQLALDWAFPALLGLTLVLWFRRAAGGRWAFALGAVAVLAALFDYAENGAVRRMLATGSADGAGFASWMTVLKSLFGGAAIAVALALLVRAVWRQFTGSARR